MAVRDRLKLTETRSSLKLEKGRTPYSNLGYC